VSDPINDGGPAFPGMSLRDWFAAMALQGIKANPSWDENTRERIARAAYEQADAMLAARERKEESK
jgi:hypothetical protein